MCAAWLELVQNEKEYLHRLAMIVDRYFLPLQTSDKHVVQQMAQVRVRACTSVWQSRWQTSCVSAGI